MSQKEQQVSLKTEASMLKKQSRSEEVIASNLYEKNFDMSKNI